MNNFSKGINLKNILLMSALCFTFVGSNAFASDNVLQAIQVDGVKDSYNIILKSDDIADLKKTIQAPNKMILTLKGIRASKTINTIYNNTSSVDSVVVEPMGEDAVKISVQADNAANAEVNFDTLKTPLGVLDKTQTQGKTTDELVLNAPMASYKPVYDDSADEETAGFSLSNIAQGSTARHIKNLLKDGKIGWTVTFGMLAIFFLGGMKTIKGKDSEIKVGLSQSLKQRELDLYRGEEGISLGVSGELSTASMRASQAAAQNLSGAYGLRAYQNGTRSPYATSEIQQRPRVAAAQPVSAPQRPVNQGGLSQSLTAIQNSSQGVALKAAPAPTRPKASNIDSMKFLESMTKIYEKNGRSDLAQGLKANMKKAKANLV